MITKPRHTLIIPIGIIAFFLFANVIIGGVGRHDLLLYMISPIIFFLVPIFFVFRHYILQRKKHQHKNKQLIETTYGVDKLLTKLGWSDITFPILCFTPIGIITVQSSMDYVDRFLFEGHFIPGSTNGTMAEKIIDSEGYVYTTYRVMIKELDYVDPAIMNIELEGIQKTNTQKTLNDIKKYIIPKTPNPDTTIDYTAIQNATSIKEVCTIL